MSRFRGTLNFCSPEMFQLANFNLPARPIDLYYNDAHGLQETLKVWANQTTELSPSE